MSDVPEQNAEAYLGDGLYVSFDGWTLWLRAPRENGDHLVGLDPAVYNALRSYIRQRPRLAGHFGEVLP